MKNILVFILDRNPVQGNILKYWLSASGIRSTTLCQTPEDCLYNIGKTRIPEFIIAEASIKNMTDMEFLNLMKITDPSVRIIFHSENDDAAHIDELLKMGATDYIVRVEGQQNWIQELISNLHYLIREELRIS